MNRSAKLCKRLRVMIVGDHPWSGHSGEALELQTFKHLLPPMVRVRLDDAPDVPEGHECFAEKCDLRLL
jgi:hypothetical protein